MCRRKTNLIFFVSVLLLSGFTSHVFAVDFSSALKQSSQDTQTATSLFDGKAQIGDLYNQALKIVKQNENSATDQSINSVVAYFTAKSCNVTALDVIHILYVSNLGFKSFLDQQVLSSLTTSRSLPTPASINASYFRFFACDKITNPTPNDFTRVQDNLIALYYQSVNGVFYSSTLAQDNVGEDVFRNGSTDDSAYDLLVDINALGDLFFSSFKQPPEVLFYKLPKAVAGGSTDPLTPGSGTPSWTNGGSGGNGGPTNDTGIDTPWVRGIGVPPSPAPLGTPTKPSSTTDALVSPSTVSQDVDVQQFLKTNDPSTFIQPNYSFLVGNACADVQKLPPSQASVQEATEDPQTYISGIVDFIDHANIDQVAEVLLQSGFNADYLAALKTNPTTAEEVIANKYSEIAFGDGTIGDGACESACIPLTGTDQIQCQLGCAKSCIQNCDGLPFDDKILCVTDCSCKLTSGPKGAGRDKVEDMFSIKFCKEPVKASPRPAKKIVSNIEGILQSFVDVLQGLKSSGQTIKEKKTKEFLDLGISLKLSELIDFKIFFAFKPIFAQKSDAAQKRKQIIENKSLVKATLKASDTPDVENYDKYVIVENIAQKNALLQPVADTASTEASFKTLEQLANASLQNPIALYQQQKNALLSEDVIKFLQEHMAFRDQFFAVTTQMLLDATTLKTKIEKN